MRQQCYKWYVTHRDDDSVSFDRFYQKVRANMDFNPDNWHKYIVKCSSWHKPSSKYKEDIEWFQAQNSSMSRQKFYERLKQWYTREQAILEGDAFKAVKKKRKPIGLGNTWLFQEEMKWFEQQDTDMSYKKFRWRLWLWYPKEEAILEWQAWEKARLIRKWLWVKKTVKQQPPRIKEVRDNTDYAFIRIRYPKEVADIFRREYERLLEDLDIELHKAWAWDRETMKEIQDKIDQVERELLVFNYFN